MLWYNYYMTEDLPELSPDLKNTQFLLSFLNSSQHDYFFDVVDAIFLSEFIVKKFNVGDFPNFETVCSFPLPHSLIDKKEMEITMNEKVRSFCQKIRVQFGSKDSEKRIELPFSLEGTFDPISNKITLDDCIILTSGENFKLDEVEFDTAIVRDRISNLPLQGRNLFIMCHNHPYINTDEASQKIAYNLDDKIKEKYGILYPGQNLSLQDIYQLVFTKFNIFPEAKTNVKFLTAVLLPNGELVIMDIIQNPDGTSSLIRY